MQYAVHLALNITSLDGTRKTVAYKEVVLPFVPFVGLSLSGRISEDISSVSWSLSENKFYCVIHATETNGHGLDDDIDIDFLVRQAKRDGWLEIKEL